MKKSAHVVWVCPDSDFFFRVKGEVKCRTSSVLPKLSEKGLAITVLIPYDATLLPKSKLAPSRITRHTIKLSQDYPVEIIKLTRADVTPSIYMLKTPPLEPAMKGAVLAKAALALAKQINRPVEIFHVFNWQPALLPLFLEIEKEKKATKIFDRTKTFLNVEDIKNQGNFAPEVMSYLDIPKTLFHPDGIEYYGQISFLKTGLIFSDGIGLVDATTRNGFQNVNGFTGILDTMMHKLRRWASGRSVKSHVEAYQELLSMTMAKPLLPSLIRKLKTTPKSVDSFILSWGPQPLDRYQQNQLSFLIQSPVKAFVFWEVNDSHQELGLVLTNLSTGQETVLAKGLWAVGDYWLDVEPNQEYQVQLVTWEKGQRRMLLSSSRVRTPANGPSENRSAVFIDVRDRRRVEMPGLLSWEYLSGLLRSGSSLGMKLFSEVENLASSWGPKVEK